MMYKLSFKQRETSIMRQGVDMNVKDQISKKNREISSYIDEIRVCMLTACIASDL